jgi:hypothetical protein
MNRQLTYLLIPCCLSLASLRAQTVTETSPPPKELPLVSVGGGLTLFKGDIGSGFVGSSFRSAWRVGVEQRMGNWLGAELMFHYGTLSRSQRSVNSNLNFESPLMYVGANAVVYFDNGLLFKRNAVFSPFINAGFGWMSFDPHGDLKDANGQAYYYWSNGAIKNLAENDINAANAVTLQRDYTYETQLTDSTTNYSRSSFAVPVGIGMRFRFSDHVGTDIRVNYNLTFTDYIDNTKAGGNDSWWWCGVSLHYKFGGYEKNYSRAELKAMNAEDYDADGVTDGNDDCQGTPAGVKVDKKGCPLDDDKDGVPDYRDKESNTKKGATVDENGVTLDYTKIADQAQRDSINNAQKTDFNNNPSQETLQQGNTDITPATTNSADCIPVQYREADFNKDCLITADEINKVIDNFFDGTGNWTAESINKLIDYFFEQ